MRPPPLFLAQRKSLIRSSFCCRLQLSAKAELKLLIFWTEGGVLLCTKKIKNSLERKCDFCFWCFSLDVLRWLRIFSEFIHTLVKSKRITNCKMLRLCVVIGLLRTRSKALSFRQKADVYGYCSLESETNIWFWLGGHAVYWSACSESPSARAQNMMQEVGKQSIERSESQFCCWIKLW